MWPYNYSTELYHYGVLGMKWGIRRYQNKDGTLTNAGKTKRKRDYRKIAKAVALTATGIGISYAGVKFSTNPTIRNLVGKALDTIGSSKISDAAESLDSLSGIVSKSLGRELTIAEAIEKGLL